MLICNLFITLFIQFLPLNGQHQPLARLFLPQKVSSTTRNNNNNNNLIVDSRNRDLFSSKLPFTVINFNPPFWPFIIDINKQTTSSSFPPFSNSETIAPTSGHYYPHQYSNCISKKCRLDGPLNFSMLLCDNIEMIISLSSTFACFTQKSQLKRFRLWSSSITIIGPNDLPDYPSFQLIQIQKSELASLSLIAFKGSFKSLQNLEIIHSKLESFPFSELRRFEQLKHLNLKYNQLKMIPDYSLENVNSLQTIDLSFNQISHVGSFAFSEMDNLAQLDLSNNALKVVNNHAFARQSILPSKLMINLSVNKMFYLSEGAFNNQSPLILDLSENSLTKLDRKIFYNLLHRMSMNGGLINTDYNRFQCKCDESTLWLIELDYGVKKVVDKFFCHNLKGNNNSKSLQLVTIEDVGC